ncbi:MAG: hypothetical protein R3E98_10090 [Gemmatimonadota bacterium]
MRRTHRLLAMLLLAGPATTLAGQDAQTRLAQALPPEAVTRIEALVERATRAGAPAEPLYDKALEGAAKRVPTDRIVAALEAYAGRLQDARTLLGVEASAPAVVAGADALQRGVSADVLRTVGGEAGERTPVALVVLGDLTEAGVPADGALDAVRQALDRGQEPDALLQVPAAVRRLLRDGITPERAARDVTRLMREGVAPQRIRGQRPGG